MKSRNEFADIINQKGYKIAVEVGVGWGGFSEFLLASCSSLTLYSVDPWTDECPEFRLGSKEYTASRLAKYGDRSQIVVMTSSDAAFTIEDDTVDFIYIDGDHSGAAVAADLEAWWPKLKVDGIIAGHDYQANRPDLVGSVDAFAKVHSNTVQVTTEPTFVENQKEAGEEAGSPSWWFEKLAT
jgi:predicted O-methyltransferase YrrM